MKLRHVLAAREMSGLSHDPSFERVCVCIELVRNADKLHNDRIGLVAYGIGKPAALLGLLAEICGGDFHGII